MKKVLYIVGFFCCFNLNNVDALQASSNSSNVKTVAKKAKPATKICEKPKPTKICVKKSSTSLQDTPLPEVLVEEKNKKICKMMGVNTGSSAKSIQQNNVRELPFVPANFSLSKVQILKKVNGYPITNVHLANKRKFLNLTYNNQHNLSDAEIMSLLIEDKIKEERIDYLEYRLKKKVITDKFIDSRIVDMASGMGISVEELLKMFKNHGISEEAFRKTVWISIGWEMYIGSKYQGQISVNSEVLKKRFFSIISEFNGETFLASRIFLPVGSPEDYNTVYAKVNEIFASIENGGNFSSFAQIYSKGIEASKGGNLGWVNKSSINIQKEEIDALRDMKKDEVKIVKVKNGFSILLLKDSQKSFKKVDLIDFKNILLPFSKTPADRSEMESKYIFMKNLVDNSKNIDDMLDRAKQSTFKVTSQDSVPISQLNVALRDVLIPLAVLRFSQPFVTEYGILVFYISKKYSQDVTPPTLDQVKNQMISSQIELFSAKEMVNARKIASIVSFR